VGFLIREDNRIQSKGLNQNCWIFQTLQKWLGENIEFRDGGVKRLFWVVSGCLNRKICSNKTEVIKVVWIRFRESESLRQNRRSIKQSQYWRKFLTIPEILSKRSINLNQFKAGFEWWSVIGHHPDLRGPAESGERSLSWFHGDLDGEASRRERGVPFLHRILRIFRSRPGECKAEHRPARGNSVRSSRDLHDGCHLGRSLSSYLNQGWYCHNSGEFSRMSEQRSKTRLGVISGKGNHVLAVTGECCDAETGKFTDGIPITIHSILWCVIYFPDFFKVEKLRHSTQSKTLNILCILGESGSRN
jgi:hypothetical protein